MHCTAHHSTIHTDIQKSAVYLYVNVRCTIRIIRLTYLVESTIRKFLRSGSQKWQKNAVSLPLSSRFMGNVIKKMKVVSRKPTDQPFLVTFSFKRCFNMLLKCIPEWNVDRNGTFLGKFLDDLTAKLVLLNVLSEFRLFCPIGSFI